MTKKKLLSTAVCAALLTPFAAANVYAQDAAVRAATDDAKQLDAVNVNDQATDLGTITVTGSRLSNPNVVSPQPVSVLTAADIKAAGAINIGDVLTTMPQLATTFTMGNSGASIGTAGLALQDLRNLGPERTLVLVNGRRMIGSSAGSTAVDTNLIPAEWIDRVEIITGGASAVYGADAVSGVINFILKKKYEGVNLNAQIGTSQHGNFNEKFLSVTGGKNFADDRGNFAVSLEHSRQDALEFKERFGNETLSTMRTPGNTFDRVTRKNAGPYSFTEGGVFSANGDFDDLSSLYLFEPDGSFRPLRFNGPIDQVGRTCQDCDYDDINNTLQLQPKYTRTTLSSVASFDLTDNHRLYFEGTYSDIGVKSLSSGAFGTVGTGNAHFIQPDNAYLTPELSALTAGIPCRTLDGSPATQFGCIPVSRDDTDSGRRGEATDRETGRVVFGIEGVFGGGDWQYDASVNYGRTHERRKNLNNRNLEKFYAGLDAVVDPATGNIVCRSQIDPTSVNDNYYFYTGTPDGIISPEVAASCVPFTIFGNGAISPGARQWFNETTITKSRLTQFVAGGSLTNNNLFELPAGPVSLAAGLEYRRETSQQINDPLDIAGRTFLNAIPSSSGSYNVKEVWAETIIPVLHDLPFIKSLSVGAAARYSDYDTAGSTRAWRYNLDWALNDSLRLRGNMSAAVRVPNIGDLYGGQSQNFGFIDDPCDVSLIGNAKDPAVRRANCAALGLPADFTDQFLGTNEGLSGSNPDLEPETGRSWTAGFVFTPSFLSGFGMNVDYWEIKLSDAISALTFEQVVERCVDTPGGINNIYCQNVTRSPDGQISFITAISQNIAARNTDGVDIGAYYKHDLLGGSMRWTLNATKTLSYDDYPFQTEPDVVTNYNGALGFPKWKATLAADYSRDDWSFSWGTRFVSSVVRYADYDTYTANPTFRAPATVGSGVVHDVRGSYNFGDSGFQLYGGVTNLFDSDPPLAQYGTTFGSAVYDTIGRAYYLGFNYKFL